MLVGHAARIALESAKTLGLWHAYEDADLVRLRAIPDGSPDLSWADERDMRYVEIHGVWVVLAEYRHADKWHVADSLGGCIYADPLDPFENCYIPEMMDAAIRQLREV